MARATADAETESGVSVLHCGKAANKLTAALLKKKLRGFPTGNLSIKTAGNS
jgi:hypothetical protein